MSVSLRIDHAYKSFVFEESRQSMSNGGYFILNYQISFLELVDQFLNCLNATNESDVLHLLLEALRGFCSFRDSIEDACEKIFSLFMMSDSLLITQDFDTIERCKTCPEMVEIFENTDILVKDTILRLQTLQERLSHLQEMQPNSIINDIMVSQRDVL